MPGKVTKTDGYRGTWGGKTVAKSTTKAKAKSQQRLLHGIEHGWRPTRALARQARHRRRKKVA